jgi:hypothetical protein
MISISVQIGKYNNLFPRKFQVVELLMPYVESRWELPFYFDGVLRQASNLYAMERFEEVYYVD